MKRLIKSKLRLAACSSLLILPPLGINGQIVILGGLVVDNVSTSLSGTELAAGIERMTLMRGPGLAVRTDFDGYYDSSSWSTSPVYPGIADDNYLSIQVQLAPTAEVVLSSIDAVWQDAGSGESARRLELRWSVDNFDSVLSTDYGVSSWPDIDFNQITLPVVGPLSGPVEFRLYGYGAVSEIGVLGLTNSSSLQLSGAPAAVALRGTVVVVPESAVAGSVLGGIVLLFAVWRRRLVRQRG